MTLPLQWLVRWGCLAVIAVGVVFHLVSLAVPFWVKMIARPPGYAALVHILEEEGVELGPNVTAPGYIVHAETKVGLWRWYVGVESIEGVYYSVCIAPALGDYPAWWQGTQALAIIGVVIGVLAGVCGVLEVYYSRRGVKFSGLVVLCAISCFVSALAIGLSTGIFASRYIEKIYVLMHLNPGVDMLPPILDWGFGIGAAGATLIGGTGVILLAFITRTYPTYHRTENVVV